MVDRPAFVGAQDRSCDSPAAWRPDEHLNKNRLAANNDTAGEGG